MKVIHGIMALICVLLFLPVTVYGVADCTITVDPAVCAGTSGHGASVPFAGLSGTYSWTILGGVIDSGAITRTISFTAGTGTQLTLYVDVDDGLGENCSGEITVVINQNPTVNISPDPGFVCSGEVLPVDGQPVQGTGAIISHSWTGTGAAYLSSTSISNPDFDGSSAPTGDYDLTYLVVDEFGCQDTDSITVTVWPDPAVSIQITGGSGSQTWVCINELVNLDGSPSGGTLPYASHTWTGNTTPLSATNIQNPTFQTSSPGIYGLTYTVVDANGCSDSDYIEITVANPAASILAGGTATSTADVCDGEDLQLDGNPSGGSGSFVSHLWTGDTTPLSSTSIQNPVFNSTTLTTFNLTYTVTDSEGCQAVDTIAVTVRSLPAADILADGVPQSSVSVCSSINLSLNGNPSGGSGTYPTHEWTGTGAVYLSSTSSQTPIFDSPDSGTFLLNYTVYDQYGCVALDTISITVDPSPVPNVDFSSNPGSDRWLCIGESAIADGNPSGGILPYTSHVWTGDTSPLSATNIQAPTFYTTTPGQYYLTYTVTGTNGCYGVQNVTVTVADPSATIQGNGHPTSFEICAGENLNLNGGPSGGSGTYPTHLWTGDTGPLSSTSVRYPVFNTMTLGSYNLTYFVTDSEGCSATDNITVVVNPVPSTTILYSSSFGVVEWLCLEETMSLNGNPSGGTGSYIHVWSGDTGPLSATNIQSPTFNASSPGEYNLAYTVVDSKGCSDTDYLAITVADPIPDIEADGVSADAVNVCSGSGILLNGNPTDGTAIYTTQIWTGDTGALSATDIQTPVFNTSSPGIYTLTYSVTDSETCEASDTIVITVDDVPVANAGADIIMDEGTSTVLNGSASSCSGGCSYRWVVLSGDNGSIDSGSASVNCTVSPDQHTVYGLTVIDANLCESWDTVDVSIANCN